MSATYILLSTVVLLVTSTPSIGQTTVMVARDSTKIVAGFDSLASDLAGRRVEICKVWRQDQLFWTEAGKRIGIEDAVIAAKRGTSSIREIVMNFDAAIGSQTERALEFLRKRDINDYNHFMKVDGGSQQYIFFGMQGQVPVIASVKVRSTEDVLHRIHSDVKEDIRDSPTSGNGGEAFTGGYDDDIRRYMAVHQIAISGDEISHLIQLEVDAVPGKVGPPIRILQVDGHGAHWIKNGHGCHIGVKNE